MWLSYVILFVSSALMVTGFILVSITLGSDHWYEYRVNRQGLIELSNVDSVARQSLFNVDYLEIYFDRSYGLFHICFPSIVPLNYGPAGTRNKCYKKQTWEIPNDAAGFRRLENASESRKAQNHLLRACVASYGIGLGLLSISLLLILCFGCIQWWSFKRKSGLIMASALFCAAGSAMLLIAMILWLRGKYLEEEVITEAPYPKTWHPLLVTHTSVDYGWSYVVFWLGLTLLIISWIGMMIGQRVLLSEVRAEEKKARTPTLDTPYPMSSYQPSYQTYPYQSYYPYSYYYGTNSKDPRLYH